MKSMWVIPVIAVVLTGGSTLGHEQKIWADNVTVKGDIRYRYEEIDEQGKETRQRERIRARLSANAKVNDRVKAGIGISTTEGGDPLSSNQTLTDEFTRKSLYIDFAYLDWKVLGESATLSAGKMKNPMLRVGNLIWDSDVHPEGLALKASHSMGDLELKANGAYFWVKEFNPDSKNTAHGDSMLYTGQAAAEYKFADEMRLSVGASYYYFANLGGARVKDLNFSGADSAFGNSTRKVVSSDQAVTNHYYLTDFAPMEVFARMTLWLGKVPVQLSGQYVINDEADDFDAGYLAGLTIGKSKNPKTWQVGYQAYELKKDAVPGFITDSDRHGGGTDGRGHVFEAKYQLMKNLQIGATYLLCEKTISDSAKTKDYNRLQLDLVASF